MHESVRGKAMGKVFRPQVQKKLPSLRGASEFTFTFKAQKEKKLLEEQLKPASSAGPTGNFQKAGIERASKPAEAHVPSRAAVDTFDFFPDDSDVDEADEAPRTKRRSFGKPQAAAGKWNRRNGKGTFGRCDDGDEEQLETQKDNRNKRLRPTQNTCNDIGSATTDFVTARQKLRMASGSQRNRTEEFHDLPNSHSDSIVPGSQDTGRPLTGKNGAIPALGGGPLKTMPRRGVRSNFVPPMRTTNADGAGCSRDMDGLGGAGGSASAMAGACLGKEHNNEASLRKCLEMLGLDPDGEVPERIRNLEPRLIEHITNEILGRETKITWADIAGLEHAKRCVMEMVIWPLKRPDLFQGTRAPGKGLLLYGPPGTGKTLIGKAIAGESNATFFSISSSSLTSKWIGEGEKLVRALFGVASCVQPAVIFIDEIDSLLSQRKEDGEHESSRRLKTQFLIEMEGCNGDNDQVLVIGATNRPQELDPAVRRRMSNRLYIPLPEPVARAEIVKNLLQKDALLTLSEDDIQAIAAATEGYSGSDMKNLVKEASMCPLREAMMAGDIAKLNKDDIRPLSLEDFHRSIRFVRPSVAPGELVVYQEWSKQFGSGELK